MSRRPRLIGTAAFFAGWLIPWKPIIRVRAENSGLVFFAHRRDVSARHVAKYGTREPHITRWIAGELARANPGLFVDVGANIGWHVLHAAKSGKVTGVVAFEPDPVNLSLLDRNLSANAESNVVLIGAAVGARRGTIRLHRYKTSNMGRHSTLTDYGYGSRIVPLIDLDGALDDLGFAGNEISVLKIDVEGGEPDVIAGAGRASKRTRAVILEFSPSLSRAGGLSPDDLLARLSAEGFLPFRFDDQGDIAPTDFNSLRRFEGQADLVFLRKE